MERQKQIVVAKVIKSIGKINGVCVQEKMPSVTSGRMLGSQTCGLSVIPNLLVGIYSCFVFLWLQWYDFGEQLITV